VASSAAARFATWSFDRLVATLVSDELQRRQDRLFARRHAQAWFRDADRSLDRGAVSATKREVG
jgi:hypothetical protein